MVAFSRRSPAIMLVLIRLDAHRMIRQHHAVKTHTAATSTRQSIPRAGLIFFCAAINDELITGAERVTVRSRGVHASVELRLPH